MFLILWAWSHWIIWMRLKDNFPAVFVLIVPGKPKHTPFQNQNQVVSGPIPNQTRNSVVEKKCCNNCNIKGHTISTYPWIAQMYSASILSIDWVEWIQEYVAQLWPFHVSAGHTDGRLKGKVLLFLAVRWEAPFCRSLCEKQRWRENVSVCVCGEFVWGNSNLCCRERFFSIESSELQ